MRKRGDSPENRVNQWQAVLNNLPKEESRRLEKQLRTEIPSENRWFGGFKAFRPLPWRFGRYYGLNPEDNDPVKAEVSETPPKLPPGRSSAKYNALGAVETNKPFDNLATAVLTENKEVKPLKNSFVESKVMKRAQKAVSRGPPARKLYVFPLQEFGPKEGHAGMFVEFGYGIQGYPEPKQWWETASGHYKQARTWTRPFGWDAMELKMPIKAALMAVEKALLPLYGLAKLNKGFREKQWASTPHALEYGDWRVTDVLGRLLQIKFGYKFANGYRVFNKNLLGDPLGKDQKWKFLEIGAEFVHQKENTSSPSADKNGWTFRVKHGYCPVFHGAPKESPAGSPDKDLGPISWYSEIGYAGTYEKPVAPSGTFHYMPGGFVQLGDSWQNFDKLRYVTYEFDQHHSTISAGFFEESDFLLREWKMPEILDPRKKMRVLTDYYKLATMKKLAEQTATYDELCLDDEKAKNEWWRRHGDCERWDLSNFKTGDIIFFSSGDVISYVVRTWTNSDVHHSTMVVWQELDNGEWKSVKEGCPGCRVGLLETTSYPTRDMTTGVVDSGYMIRHLFNKVAEQPPDTRVFAKHRNVVLTDKQMFEMMTLTDCLYTRRPLYLYGAPHVGADAFTRRSIMVNEKITNPQDSTFERSLCSGMTGFFVEMWNEVPMIFEYEEGKPIQGRAVQVLTPERQDAKGNTKTYKGAPLMPGDFSPHDLAYMTHKEYNKLVQVERPWHGFSRFRQQILDQEAIVRANPQVKTWVQLATSCAAGIGSLKFVVDFMPYWHLRMEYVAKQVMTGNIKAIQELPTEEAITGWITKDAGLEKLRGPRMTMQSLSFKSGAA